MTKPTRTRRARFALAGLIGLVLLASSVLPGVLVDEATGNDYLGELAAGILPFVLGLWLAPKISYRRRDALVFLTIGASAIPSAFLFVKLIWRLPYLPHRDWPLRPDEVAAGRHTSHVPPPAEEPEPQPQPQPSPPTPVRPPWARDVTDGYTPTSG